MKRILTVAALWLASAEVAAADCAEARSIWGDVKDSGSAQVFEEYLSVFGDCAIYSGLAREKLAALGNVQPSAPVSAPEHDPEPAVADNDEGQLSDWEVFEIENACMRAAIAPLHVEDYMGRAWDDIVTEEALAACAPVMDLDDPDPEAMAAYGRLVSSAIRWLDHGGLLLAASCSAQVAAEDFFRCVRDAGRKSGRRFRELETTGHAPDHPIGFPEAAYLKGIYLRFD